MQRERRLSEYDQYDALIKCNETINKLVVSCLPIRVVVVVVVVVAKRCECDVFDAREKRRGRKNAR